MSESLGARRRRDRMRLKGSTRCCPYLDAALLFGALPMRAQLFGLGTPRGDDLLGFAG